MGSFKDAPETPVRCRAPFSRRGQPSWVVPLSSSAEYDAATAATVATIHAHLRVGVRWLALPSKWPCCEFAIVPACGSAHGRRWRGAPCNQGGRYFVIQTAVERNKDRRVLLARSRRRSGVKSRSARWSWVGLDSDTVAIDSRVESYDSLTAPRAVSDASMAMLTIR